MPRPPKTNPTIDPDHVREGDILFFAPPEETDDFAVFDQLAAFVQGAPWTHVAIAGHAGRKGPKVIGFGQTGDPGRVGDNWTAEIDECEWHRATARHAVTAWRHPALDSKALSAAAEEQIGTKYDMAGLLAFAAATQARLFRHGPSRQRLGRFARGVVAANRDGLVRHTCVSAVGAALQAVEFDVPVLDPAHPPHDPAKLRDPLTCSIMELFQRAESATAHLGISMEERVPILDEEQIAAAWPTDLDDATVEVPGLIATTKEYLALLGAVMARQQASGHTVDTLVRLGDTEPEPGAVHATVSPAMLRDGLIRSGFVEVS